jgi:hypothetical protein
VCDTMDIVDEQDGLMYVMKDFFSPSLVGMLKEGGTSDEGGSDGGCAASPVRNAVEQNMSE